MVTRKNVNSLNSSEKTELVTGLKALKSSGRYDLYVSRHKDAPMINIHQCPAFLPWHRQFTLDLELEMQTVTGNSNFALPYWNWAEDVVNHPNPINAPVWQNDLLGGSGNPADSHKVSATHPFNNTDWPITVMAAASSPPSILETSDTLIRELGLGTPTLPTQAHISSALGISEYDTSPYDRTSSPSFRNTLEGWIGTPVPGLHNRGHVWIGGHMSAMVSPNDPIFFLHHCFIDKIWSEWQAANGLGNYIPVSGGSTGQNKGDNMEATVSGAHKVEDVLDISTLNYRYDDTSAPGNDNCFIATAAFGGLYEPEVRELRKFRDWIMQHHKYGNLGEGFVEHYYRISPSIARVMNKNKLVFYAVKYGIVYPGLLIARHFPKDKNK